MPFVETSDREFVKLAQKAVSDLFDWAVQTDQQLNEMIKDILINDGGVGRELTMFVNDIKKNPRHPLYNNQVINIIEGIPSMRAAVGGPNNAKLNMGETKVYDQNNVIYAFRELRDYLKGEKNPLYDRIVTLSVLQSGLSTSPISFTSLLPYEDFENVYNKTLSKLEGMSNLEDFYKLGVFQRNNWNNDDVVPYLKAALIKTAAGRTYYNPSMKFLPDAVTKAVIDGDIPPVLTRSKRNREANSDYIVYTWEKQEELLTEQELKEAVANRQLYKAIANKKAEMRKANDYSFINKGLFKKVYDDYGTPLEHTDYKGQKYFVYKAINAWGDSFRANEFWATDHKSVIENGFMKVEDVHNNLIISMFLDGSKVKTSASATAPTAVPSGKTINIYAGTGENAELSNFAIRPFTIAGETYDSVEQYFQLQKFQIAEVLTFDYDSTNAQSISNKITEIADKIASTKNGAELKRLGNTRIPGTTFNEEFWNKEGKLAMKQAMIASFSQNPSALKSLLATGKAELTHTQDNTKWGKEFPKLLMEVRKELSMNKKDPFTC
jgi:ribA/ribD-fused uncharacterized protein